MNSQIRMTLIANAGVFIEYKEHTLLVDGLQDGAARLFPTSPTPEETIAEMTSGGSPLSNIDTLLFTHEHRDHLSLPLLLRYLENNRVKRLILPAGINLFAAWPEKTAVLNDCIICHADRERIRAFQIDAGVIVYALPTAHMGEQFHAVCHSCFLIDLDGITLLFLGDADPASASLNLVPSINMVFTNPVFLHNPVGRHFIRTLHPYATAVYHIPYEKDGRQYRHAVLHEIQSIEQEGFPVFPFCTAGQVIVYDRGRFLIDAS